MKEITFATRLNTFVNRVLDALVTEQRAKKSRSGNKASGSRVSTPQRNDFFHSMLVIDDETKQAVGHLADISTGGFKLDTRNPVPVNKDFQLRMQLPGEVSNRLFMVFGARSRWCSVDSLDPCIYNVGYQLVHFAPEDLEVFIRMMQKYGSDLQERNSNLRRSSRW